VRGKGKTGARGRGKTSRCEDEAAREHWQGKQNKTNKSEDGATCAGEGAGEKFRGQRSC
jgi:hypothetical protein